MFKLEVDFKGLIPAISKLEALSLYSGHILIETLARDIQSQTRERIANTHTGPDGEKWPVRKEDGKPALFRTGHNLFDTIDYQVSGHRAEIGTGFKGALAHQFGAVIVPKNGKALVFNFGGKTVFTKKVTLPARPFMGLSAANIADLHEVAAETIGALL